MEREKYDGHENKLVFFLPRDLIVKRRMGGIKQGSVRMVECNNWRCFLAFSNLKMSYSFKQTGASSQPTCGSEPRAEQKSVV